jgi:antitoxin ParD1/3/4
MNVTISLTPELNDYVKTKVQSGRYGSTSEVMREALRLLEQQDELRERENAYFRQLIDDGLASGNAGPLDLSRIKAEGRRQLAAAKGAAD